jgi:rhodanese-related sulfurtransferase/mannose-6-phosphate isomerase-like protein (cupin superfamily)
MTATAELVDDTTAQQLIETNTGDITRRTPDELADIVSKAAASNEWIKQVRLSRDQRWYERLYLGHDYDLWVISWMPGQSTGFHDHGASSGAYVVVMGKLEELRSDARTHKVRKGETIAFDEQFAHDVRNTSETLAVSIHAYSPPLAEMNHYDLDAGAFVLRHEALPQVSDSANLLQNRTSSAEDSHIDRVLTTARARLKRVLPHEAFEAAARPDAVLIDIRPASQRASEGLIPGALIVERNVLEWRLDPSSNARLPIANSIDLQMIVFCSQGYASSLAASDLQDIGLWRATDVIGGFQAWRDAGLPAISPTTAVANEQPYSSGGA